MGNRPQEFLAYGVMKNAGHFYSIKNNPISIFPAIGLLSLAHSFPHIMALKTDQTALSVISFAVSL